MTGGELALLISTAGVAIAGIVTGLAALWGRSQDGETLAQQIMRTTLETLGEDYTRVRTERDVARDRLNACRDDLARCHDEKHD
jgi:hypothetical protein